METIPMNQWAKEDQPVYKLAIKGKQSLSDAELLSVVLGSGNLDTCRQILQKAENNLHELAKMMTFEYTTFKGIGKKKAAVLVAAMELGRRRQSCVQLHRNKVTSSKDIADVFQPMLGDHTHEEFWAMFLNRNNKVLRKVMISSGSMSGTVVDPKMIFKAALDSKAASAVLCHNHPSGNVQPSQADITLTKRLVEAGKVMELPILDHVIVSQASFYSFADESLL